MTLEKARYVKMPYLCGFQQFICGQRVTNQKVIIILNLIQYNVKAPRINSKGLKFYAFKLQSGLSRCSHHTLRLPPVLHFWTSGTVLMHKWYLRLPFWKASVLFHSFP